MQKIAYLFWYCFDAYSKTEYVYVIAVSLKQAMFLWQRYLRENVGRVYDKAETPVNEIGEQDFIKRHEVGEVLGGRAII